MRAPERTRFDLVFRFGPAFAALAAFLVWSVFAWAVGLHWRAVLGVGVLACVTAVGYTVVIVGAAGLGGETEARRWAPAARLRQRRVSVRWRHNEINRHDQA
jgi:hypothetical protein